jgi:SAM-dependent methyltransferase
VLVRVHTSITETLKSALNFMGLAAAVGDLRRQTGYVFDAKTRRRNARFKARCAPDGLPMPPPGLIYLVTGQFDAEAFYQNGVMGAACIETVLGSRSLKVDAFGDILDFGCGCGRVIRQWRKLQESKVHGVDYNPRLIRWCKKNLPFAEFSVNTQGTALSFSDETFDFIYSISVFTHLTESNQRFWMKELTRVLKPGGYLLFTVHGISRLNELPPDQRHAFESGTPITVGGRYSGTNFCGTYHPEPYIRNVLCKDLLFVGFEPGGAKDANQDIFLMQRPA